MKKSQMPFHKSTTNKEIGRKGLKEIGIKNLKEIRIIRIIILAEKSLKEIRRLGSAACLSKNWNNYFGMTRQEYNHGILLNFGEKHLRAERYLYDPADDNFILLTQENYKSYIDG